MEGIMIDDELVEQFRSMDAAAPRLMRMFNMLTRAHMFFQGPVGLRTISVSDVLENGSIEATFQGVRIKFELLPVFSFDRRPLGRVVCMHCHCTYGTPAQDLIGAFTFDDNGVTDLLADQEGNFPRMDSDAPEIVLRFLNAAFSGNRKI
jgi:hypothetical protein